MDAMFSGFMDGRWLPVLADAALKSLVLLGIAGLAVWSCHRASSAFRHLVWAVAIIGILLLPALSILLPAWRVAGIPEWRESLNPGPMPAATATISDASAAPTMAMESDPATAGTATPTDQPLSPTAMLLPAPASSAPAAAIPTPRNSTPAAPPATSEPEGLDSCRAAASPTLMVWLRHGCLIGWLAGTLICLAGMLTGMIGIFRLGRRSFPVMDPEWQGLLQDLSQQIGLTRRVELRFSTEMTMPLTWGAWRPVLLLPVAAREWSLPRRRLVLLHELAHVRRWDWLTQMIGQFSCALYWFNPLAWLAVRRMRIEREKACDDLVLIAGEKASDYAEELLNIATCLPNRPWLQTATVPMARRSSLEERLRAILNASQRRIILNRRMILATLAGLMVILVPVAMLQAKAPHTPDRPDTAITPPAEKPADIPEEIADNTAEPDPAEPEAKKADEPIVLLPARTFNSDLPLQVSAILPDGKWIAIGKTPSAKPLEIPACRYWCVVSEEKTNLQPVILEAKKHDIPGLYLRDEAQDSDLALIGTLTHLQVLDLYGEKITDQGLTALANLKELRELRFARCPITNAGLRHLGGLTTLKKLTLCDCRQVTDAGLAHLKNLTALQYLCLLGTSNKITDSGWAHLRDMTELEELYLWNTSVTATGLSHLSRMTKLHYLSLDGSTITRAGIARLAKLKSLRVLSIVADNVDATSLSTLKQLKHLSLYDSAMSYREMEALEKALPNTRIFANPWYASANAPAPGLRGGGVFNSRHHFRVWIQMSEAEDPRLNEEFLHASPSTPMQGMAVVIPPCLRWWVEYAGKRPDETLADICEEIQARKIPGVCFHDEVLQGEDTSCLKKLQGVEWLSLEVSTSGKYDYLSDLPPVHELWISARLTDAQFKRFVKGQTALQSLACDATKISDSSLKVLKKLPALRNLTLGMNTGYGPDKNLALLQSIKSLTRLSLLNIPASEKNLVVLRQLPAVKHLLLHLEPQAGRPPVADLSPLQDMRQLEVLELHDSLDEADINLSFLENLTQLRELRIISRRVDDSGLAHFKNLPNLQRLTLGCPKITDAGMVHLEKLKRLKSLGIFGLNENLPCQITDAGLEHLRDLTNLKELGIDNAPKVTRAGLLSLRKSLPGVERAAWNPTRIMTSGPVAWLGKHGRPVYSSGLLGSRHEHQDPNHAEIPTITGLKDLEILEPGMVPPPEVGSVIDLMHCLAALPELNAFLKARDYQIDPQSATVTLVLAAVPPFNNEALVRLPLAKAAFIRKLADRPRNLLEIVRAAADSQVGLASVNLVADSDLPLAQVPAMIIELDPKGEIVASTSGHGADPMAALPALLIANPEARILIRIPDPATPHDKMIEFLNACGKAKLKHIDFTITPAKPVKRAND